MIFGQAVQLFLNAIQLRFSVFRILEACNSRKDDSGKYNKYKQLKHHITYIHVLHLMFAGEIHSLPFLFKAAFPDGNGVLWSPFSFADRRTLKWQAEQGNAAQDRKNINRPASAKQVYTYPPDPRADDVSEL